MFNIADQVSGDVMTSTGWAYWTGVIARVLYCLIVSNCVSSKFYGALCRCCNSVDFVKIEPLELPIQNRQLQNVFHNYQSLQSTMCGCGE